MRTAAQRVSDAPLACPVCETPVREACVWHASVTCRCVVRCDACGHRFRVEPDADWLDGAVYDAGYHAHRKTAGRPGFVHKQETAHLHLALFRAARGTFAGARLLDVGCATGDFLAAAHEAGLAVKGVELSAPAAATAAARAFAVQRGRIEDVADGPFDLVHASHVLEHVPDVRAFVLAVGRLLAPGGLALLEVPNEFDEALALLRRASGRVAPARLDAPHLHYFGTRSLRTLVGGAGLLERRLLTYSHRRPSEPALGAPARLRHVGVPNVVLRLADRIGCGRNLVMLVERPAS